MGEKMPRIWVHDRLRRALKDGLVPLALVAYYGGERYNTSYVRAKRLGLLRRAGSVRMIPADAIAKVIGKNSDPDGVAAKIEEWKATL